MEIYAIEYKHFRLHSRGMKLIEKRVMLFTDLMKAKERYNQFTGYKQSEGYRRYVKLGLADVTNGEIGGLNSNHIWFSFKGEEPKKVEA